MNRILTAAARGLTDEEWNRDLREEVNQFLDVGLTGSHGGEGRHYRDDTPTRYGRARAWDPCLSIFAGLIETNQTQQQLKDP